MAEMTKTLTGFAAAEIEKNRKHHWHRNKRPYRKLPAQLNIHLMLLIWICFMVISRP